MQLLRRGAIAARHANPPPPVPWSAAYWADDPAWSHPADGGAVSSFRDYSGHSLDAVQGTGTRQPLFRASVAGLNGHAAIQGDGFDDYLVSPAVVVAQPYTVFAIGSMVLGAGASGAFPTLVTVGNAANYVLAPYRTSSHNFVLFAGTADAASVTGDNNCHIFRSYLNGPSSVLRVGASGNTGSPGANSTGDVRLLGRDNTDTTHNAGYLGFAGLFAGDLAASGYWTALMAWGLAWYGLVSS